MPQAQHQILLSAQDIRSIPNQVTTIMTYCASNHGAIGITQVAMAVHRVDRGWDKVVIGKGRTCANESVTSNNTHLHTGVLRNHAVGKAIITGNHRTKYAVIKRELVQQEDTPFDYSVLMKERQRLYKLGLFTDVNIEVLDRYDDSKDVLMKLHEGNAGAVELSLGYAEYERYRGVIDLSYRNLWGMNRQVSLKLDLSSLEKRYILQYYEPWLGGTALPFRAFILGEDKKEINIDTRETRYQLIRHTVTAGIEKKLKGGIEASREICRYAAERGVRILPGVGTSGCRGYYFEGNHAFNAPTWVRRHPELESRVLYEGKPVPGCPCPSKPENKKWLADGARWLFENFEIGGVNLEMGDYFVCPCPDCRKARAAIPSDEPDYYKDMAICLKELIPVMRAAAPDAWLSYATYTGFNREMMARPPKFIELK